jgi:branched-subunit amino acid ABC-type transport system permease component
MQTFIAQVINGLSLGSIYVLLATGFSYPQVVVFSMYIAWVVLRYTGNSIVLAVLAAILSSVLLNLISAPLFQQVMKNREEVDINTTMVLSLGIGMIITDVLSHGFNKGLPIAFPSKLIGETPILRVGLISLQGGQVASLAVGVLAVSGIFLLLYKTRPGRAFRAIAEDPNGARLVGIPLLRTGFESYALSGVLGGLIAVLLAMLLGYSSPGLGEQVAHKVLAVSIIAGLGNLVGGLVVGLALGILEALVQGYISGSWSNAIAFVVMLLVMLFRPRGLFGIKL